MEGLADRQEDGQMGKYIDDASCISETQKGSVAREHALSLGPFGSTQSTKWESSLLWSCV